MEFETLRDVLKEKNRSVYEVIQSQDLDEVSFYHHSDDEVDTLSVFYKDARELLTANGFWRDLFLLNCTPISPLKRRFSKLNPISAVRMMYKWLNISDGSMNRTNIEAAQTFLQENWLHPDFYPFLPRSLASNTLCAMESATILCRMSSTKNLCISFTFYAEDTVHHVRMLFDTTTKTLIPRYMRHEPDAHKDPLSGKTIEEVKSAILSRESH
uniref:Uncharacterized protein n=1 Tax=Pithovirus LCPAC304 TaxID=2506594 RepID=A0A481ZAW3_9VIRU|nr:MAG: hypothetical protein LCPAC304_06570 [Pithovirus LCPAC304]